MLKVSQVVFAAFMQHCIQHSGTHVRGVKSVLYSVYRALHPSKREGYSKSPQSYGLSSSPVREGSFVLTFWDLSNYKGSSRQDSQPTVNCKKTKGPLSNPVLLTDLWDTNKTASSTQ